ncbi:MAG: Ig-like domain-containing protein [Flavobacteriaceae bacterium]|nr:Ig-like domain-containing protein [Flavobacteriaceae bacterium]
MKLQKHLPVAFLFVLFLFSCTKNNDQPTDNLFKFKDYIFYTTSGVVSITEPIEIGLAMPIENDENANEIPQNYVSIQPLIQGTLSISNARTLIFKPQENLKPNTEYTVSVHLDKIYPRTPSEYKTYTFKFKTIQPAFSINTGNLQSYSKEWQYIEGTVKSADVLPLETVHSLLKVSQNGKELPVKWSEASAQSTFYEFKIDSIHRQVDDSEIQISWSGKKYGIDNEGESKRRIPGISNFTIVKASVVQSPEQQLILNFSDPLKKQQNFNGLVSIENAKDLKFVADGNVLRVYPASRLSGNVQVDVFQGIQSTDGFKLKQPFSEKMAFEQLKPAVRLISNGVILPNSNNLKLNFEAVNLKSIDVRVIKVYENNVLQFLQENNLNGTDRYNIRRVGRRIAKKTIHLMNSDIENDGKWKVYAIDLTKLIKVDPGAIYRVELSFLKDYAIYKCEGQTTNTSDDEGYDDYYEEDYYYGDQEYNTEQSEDMDEREEQYWDNLIYSYQNNHYYNWEDRENPCKEAYYHNENNTVTTNILGSNLGLIAKRSENESYYFAVTDILTTEPVSGATVKLYNFQQQEVGSMTTDSNGLALFDADHHASFAIVTKNNNYAYVKLDDGNSLSVGNFDVSGTKLQKGLKGYIYGERGVWRPGDTLHLSFVLNDNANPLPKGHPVRMEVTDPHGKLAYKSIETQGNNGFYKFQVPTSDMAATGNWNAKVIVGGTSFSKSLKVETVKPNRLKIKIDFDKEILAADEPLNGKLQVNWLHGAPAKNIKAEVQAKFTSTSTAFKNYPGFVFNDPIKTFSPVELTVFDGQLDGDGKATIIKKPDIDKNAPGMLKAVFLTRAFENGGDFSMDVFTRDYAPYKTFVGLKMPKPRAYGSYYTDEEVPFEVVTVNAQGQPVRQRELEVKVYKVEWRWWWNSSYDDLASYVGSQYHRPFKSFTISTSATGKASFKVNIPDNEGGRYLIRVFDPESGHATGSTAYFYKNWWRSPTGSDPQAAKMLIFSSDKKDYKVGEKAVITFPSGTEGRALVSIENGTEVLSQQWVKTQKGETSVTIPITGDMAPNVFANISLLQPHASTANDLPIRLYGIIPLMVNDPNTILTPQINMPKTLKPEEKYTVKVSEKDGKPMTYTLAVVDEGLLDLTRFKTPDIWNSFYAKEALGVKTWDIFDYVIGAYGGSIEQVFGIGGDEDATPSQPKKANRFKPVVTYLGPFELKKGETQTHTLKMPKYIGSVRTMVVAGNNTNKAYGSAEETTPVRKPLMVLATLPRKLSPGETVTLPVTVFAMEPKVKQATISLKLGKGVQVIGEQTQTLTFDRPDEKMVYFNLDVSGAEGISTVEVNANGNGEKASYQVEIDVVNTNPISTVSKELVLEANATETLDFETFGVAGTNTATVEFSTLPPMDFSRRLQYLIRYPYGCVEQVTSSVFPQLYLSDILDLTYDKKQQIENNIKKGIEKLGYFQTPNGGMSYWMGQNTANDWGTSYAGHFMIEAQKKGYILPLTFMNNWLSYQQEAARNWRPSYRAYNSDLAQAYRLYTLALAGHPDLSSMNRLREFSELSNEAKWRLAAAYALAGQKEAAVKISNTANIDFIPSKYDYYTYGSVDRNRAMAMETMLLLGNTKYRDLASYIAKDLSSNRWMSTQTTAFSLLAMAKMVELSGGKDINLKFNLNKGKPETVSTTKTIAGRPLAIKLGSNSVSISNNIANTVYVRVFNSGVLPFGEELAERRNLVVSAQYTDMQGKAIDITKLEQGTDFKATVTVTNMKMEYVNDVALTEIFPSGWEITNTRFTDYGDSTKSLANYTDIRDDRVNFFFDLDRGKSKTFTVLLNAAYLGKYYLPGLQTEAMYDNDYFARNKGQWVEIVK